MKKKKKDFGGLRYSLLPDEQSVVWRNYDSENTFFLRESKVVVGWNIPNTLLVLERENDTSWYGGQPVKNLVNPVAKGKLYKEAYCAPEFPSS